MSRQLQKAMNESNILLSPPRSNLPPKKRQSRTNKLIAIQSKMTSSRQRVHHMRWGK
jgi:hypothetical protein